LRAVNWEYLCTKSL